MWGHAMASTLVLLALSSQGCGSKPQGCNAPHETIYVCAAQAPDAGGCLGGVGGAGSDAGVSYPVGCSAITPTCSGFDPSAPLVCTCETLEGDAGPLLWICPD